MPISSAKTSPVLPAAQLPQTATHGSAANTEAETPAAPAEQKPSEASLNAKRSRGSFGAIHAISGETSSATPVTPTTTAPASAETTQANAVAAGVSAPAPSTFDEVLAAATTKTLMGLLRGITTPANPDPIPDQLTAEQKSRVQFLLKQYHPEVLTSDPFIDSAGKPMRLEPSFDMVIDHDPSSGGGMKLVKLSDKQKADIKKMFDNYPEHQAWLHDHVEIRKIQPLDVPAQDSALHGAEGVFFTKQVPKGTFLMLFDGMMLANKADIRNDKKLRKLADCDNYYSRPAQNGAAHVLEALGVSMKLNTSNPFGDGQYSEGAVNISAFSFDAVNKDNGKPYRLFVLRAKEQLGIGDHGCYIYNPESVRP